tara:strand:+ start:4076 stop:4471 length:396 start_codon:yes stop_codon:yes gene_type:complete
MKEEDKTEGFKYYEVASEDYTDQEIKIFVECLMVGDITAEWTLKCLTAVALNIGISEEEYEESEYEESEDSVGEVETYVTSDFIKFVDQSLVLLLLEGDRQGWIELYRSALIQEENYEALHKLKLESQWNF